MKPTPFNFPDLYEAPANPFNEQALLGCIVDAYTRHKAAEGLEQRILTGLQYYMAVGAAFKLIPGVLEKGAAHQGYWIAVNTAHDGEPLTLTRMN